MIRPHRQQFGFGHNDNLVLLCVVLLSVGILLPTVKRLMDVGVSWWLSILLGLVPVALFWMAFASVAMAFIQIALWLEKRER